MISTRSFCMPTVSSAKHRKCLTSWTRTKHERQKRVLESVAMATASMQQQRQSLHFSCSPTTTHLQQQRYQKTGSGHPGSGNNPLIVGIRREDASIWERRSPLAPHHVKRLTKAGVRILIQPSNRRAYPLQSYIRAGAEAREDISEAPVVLGVKQVPVDQLLPGKTYCFFSHTIKAQESNMALLDAVLERQVRLIDYERLVDYKGDRVVAFGKFAGVAGMINILHGLGLRLLALGHHTPFMHVGPAHNYRNSGTAKQAIRDVGYEIALGKMPRSIGPLTFVFTGSGNVSQGAQEVFAELPVEFVDPSDLREAAEQGSTAKIYGSVVRRSDHLRRKPSLEEPSRLQYSQTRHHRDNKDNTIDLDEYTQHPSRYTSDFSSKIAPYASVIINGMYWPPDAPRLLTIPDAKMLQMPVRPEYNAGASANNPMKVSSEQRLQQQLNSLSVGSPSLPHRLLAICDISADPAGSIEFMQRCTTIDNPFNLYDAQTNTSSDQSFAGRGFLICSIDNMPTQLPLEATDMFGNLLFPHIMDMIRSDASKPVDDHRYSQTVRSAIIASNGKLQPDYEYINELRSKQVRTNSKYKADPSCKEVLVLGAGHVSSPLIEYLCRDPKIHVTLVSSSESEVLAQTKFAEQHQNLLPVTMDIQASAQNSEDDEKLRQLVTKSDVVVSLLPYRLHPLMARKCIDAKTNMLTASYLSQGMKELHDESVKADITILNEVGLDPGIDHLLSKRVIDQVHDAGGRITSFESYCCGLPTPEFADNPLGYKFGWNPVGAFAVTMNGAKWRQSGKLCEIAPGGDLMANSRSVDSFLKGFALEAFPNRNSLEYQQLYNLPDSHTIIRGTLRYKGFSDTIMALKLIGLMDQQVHPYLDPSNLSKLMWRELISREILGHSARMTNASIKALLYEKLDKNPQRVNSILELGLLEDEPVIKCGSPFNTIRHKLVSQYSFKPEDNDLVIMRINLDIEWPSRSIEKRAINLVVYGEPRGFSAMSRTVGLPAAIATKMILSGEIQDKGMVLPLTPQIYEPILQRLAAEGIVSRET